MKMERNVDAASGLVTITMSGKVTYEGLIQAIRGMLDDPKFRKGANNLWDFRNADSDHLTNSDIQGLAAFIEKYKERRGEGYKVAFVVAHDVNFGLARVYEGYAGRLPFKVMVYRSMEEALSWIRM
jgi:hypothetical protein